MSTDLERAFDFVSSRDAEKYGGAEPPPPRPCEFCGKTLYWNGIARNGSVSAWWVPELCDCAQAKEKREADRKAEEERKAAEEAEADRKRKRDRIDRLIGQSGIGRRFMMRTFDNFVCETEDQTKCYEIALEYAEHFEQHAASGTGIFFAGKVGTGKTHLAAAIALYLMNKGTPVIFRTGIDMFADIRKAYSGDVSESAILGTYKTVDLLIIDDLGKEKMTEWAASMLFGIINARYENMLPTIITTNIGTAGLEKSFGEDTTRAQAIISRLQETSIDVPMKWGDYRRR